MKDILISIVDDQKLLLSTLSGLLNLQEGIRVVYTASDGVDFFDKLEHANELPDIVLMDLSMPNMDGIEATKKLRITHPHIKVIIITMHDEDPYILSMIEYGVEGYLFKNVDIKEIVNAIVAVYNGEKYYDRKVLLRIANRYSEQIEFDQCFSNNTDLHITNRELEILKLLCKAETAKEIGEKLNISERTVEVHRNSLLKKTNSKNTTALVLFALYENIVKPNRELFSWNRLA